jgi:hypothetical protein
MEETQKEITEVYSYNNPKGVKVYTPNLEFAKIMANKYGTFVVNIENN